MTEVELGFSAETAGDEAQRCYQCHFKYEIDSDKCIYCDWCVKAKPRPECILKIKSLHHDANGRLTGWEIARKVDEVSQVWINQADCIRCGACVAACPVDAISIQKVSLHAACPVTG
jgi:ferredoxin